MSINGTQTPAPNKDLAVLHENTVQELETLFNTKSLLGQEFGGVRKKAFDRYREMGLPSLKWEDWKYFNLKGRLPESMSPLTSDSEKSAQELSSPDLFSSPYRLYLINGNYISSRSHLPEGLEIEVLQESHQTEQDQKWLQEDSDSRDPFQTLNVASFQQALQLKFPKDWSSDEPLVILHDFDQEAKDHQVPSRIHVHVGAFSNVQLIEHYISSQTNEEDELPLLSNDQTHIYVEESANVTHLKFSQLPQKSLHVGNLTGEIKKAATLNAFTMTLSSAPHRHNIHLKLLEEQAHAQADGLYTLRGNDYVDHFAIIDHQKSHTTSDQLFKGILDENARGAFTGKIIVERHAQKVEAEQLNKNLLLSKKAKIDTRPQLEVYADDVSCAHGATVGQISEDELFYLESRGLPKIQAYKMLCHAFASDVILRVPGERLQEWLMKRLYEGYERFSDYDKLMTLSEGGQK